MQQLAKMCFILTALLPATLFAKINVTQALIFNAKVGEPTAIFMNIYNEGEEDVSLATVQSDIGAHLTLHGTQNGRMVELSDINVPAHKMTSLKRGGLHIMVFDVEQDLKAGNTFPLRLLFDNGEVIKVDAKIIQYQ